MLLTLALPLQALASASMLGCAFAHPAVALQVTATDPMATCHDDSGPDAPSPGQHDCKQCAVCYLASAMPIPVVDPGLIVPVPSVHPATAVTRLSGVIPDNPERPPRQPLA